MNLSHSIYHTGNSARSLASPHEQGAQPRRLSEAIADLIASAAHVG